MHQAAKKKKRRPLAEVVPLPPHKSRVVVAEDDPALRRALAIALDCDGYEVIEVEDGSQLLDLIGDQALTIDAGSPCLDLLITDVCMPGFSGLQALAAIRQLALNTPCIVVTAFITPEIEAQAMRLGAAAMFKKPFDVDDLLKAVANLVR